ncbi:Crp/Fnr family transcriptional regulator [Thiocapsa rosea]|uniref:CRP-like cAMP-binding protein n=1 Tax=Thiocapsa rosea TaxID=69360 RepID=A0A495V766_9GAMM|nr:Crp/Fnr family transcriptional regulator [Thiocapsa rosea]RKT45159.1 CRP-like cAMP-binding protein [Thiocapsa rosea]
MNDIDRAFNFLPFLRDVPAFAALGDEPARFIAGGSQLRVATRGQIVCEKGSRPSGFQCLLEGRIKLAALSPLGAERVLDILQPGRVFGVAAILLDAPCPVFAESICDSRILVVGRDRIHAAIAEWPEVAAVMLKLVAEDVHRLVHDLEACCLMSARQRLADFLLQQGRCSSDAVDRAVVVLPAAKALVASNLNITAETFSRELHELAHRGLVEIERRTILIPSLDRLAAFVFDDPMTGREPAQLSAVPVPS